MRVPCAVEHFCQFAWMAGQPQHLEAALLLTQRLLREVERIAQKIGDLHRALFGQL